VSFANGFAAANNMLVYPFPSLAAYAGLEVTSAVLRDARRGETYLHLAAEGLDHVELLPLQRLAARLSAVGPARIIAEAAMPDDPHGQAWREAVEAGVDPQRLSWAARPAAESMLRLLSQVEPATFAEPAYLRGFL
jgi:tRNA A37 threonylcarbamoyladenosine modification protein TsaB